MTTSRPPYPALVAGPAMARRLVVHLEEFWPSRRSHAFDELCR